MIDRIEGHSSGVSAVCVLYGLHAKAPSVFFELFNRSCPIRVPACDHNRVPSLLEKVCNFRDRCGFAGTIYADKDYDRRLMCLFLNVDLLEETRFTAPLESVE